MNAQAEDVAYARPARPQISFEELDVIRTRAERSASAGMTYNIWYNKMSHGDTDDGGPHNKKHSETRCDLARDAGYTRADIRVRQAAGGGIMQDAAYCCLFFARGSCPNGYVARLTQRKLYLSSPPSPCERGGGARRGYLWPREAWVVS